MKLTDVRSFRDATPFVPFTISVPTSSLVSFGSAT